MKMRRPHAFVAGVAMTAVLLGGCGDDEDAAGGSDPATEADATTTTGAPEPEESEDADETTTEAGDESGSGETGCAAIDEALVESIFGFDVSDVSQPDEREGWESCAYAGEGRGGVALQRLSMSGNLMFDQVGTLAPDAHPIDVGDEAVYVANYDETVQGSAVTIYALDGEAFVQVVVTILGTPAGSAPDQDVIDGAAQLAELAL